MDDIMKKSIASLFAITLFLYTHSARAEAIVVVSNAPGSISTEELRNIYFQNGGRLSNGQVVTPLDYKEDNSARERFYQRAFGRSRVQMKAYWAQRIFTGKGNPPQSIENAKEAVNLITAKSASYIAYMNESEADSKLAVLLRLP